MAGTRALAPVSVVLPTYQRADVVERAISSVLEQTLPPQEVIVVDDGSTDDTAARLARFGRDITIIRQGNAGASVARNRGVEAAAGPWVAFCDSDDHWYPDHLERVLTAVERTGGAAELYFDDTAIDAADGGGTFFGVAGLRLRGTHELAAPVAPWLLAPLQPMLLQSSVVRRTTFLGLGGLAPELRVRHDTHLFFRLGFRHLLCAVAGVGGVLAADVPAAERLTGAGGHRSASFWEETLWMHRDLLPQAPDVRTKAEMRRRLAATHLKLGAVATRGRQPLPAVGHLARAVTGAPGEVVRLAGRGVARRAAGRARDDGRIPRPA